jgi:CheY-like chemotaxis protein
LVDDEERFLLNLAKLLKRRGFDVSTAPSGQQALDILSSRKNIAVVVLDVRMPGMDGLETLGHIKQQSPETEVIMLTGQATLEDGIEALRGGAFYYIQKPCDIDELEAKIRDAFSVEQIKRHPVLWPRYEVGEIILSGFVPLLPEDTLERALEIFNRYRHGEGAQMLFVVDERRHILGVISRSDVLKAVENVTGDEPASWEWVCRHPQCLPETTVGQIMEREVASVSSATSLAETARLMLQHHYDSMPVTADETVLGIVRLRDVLQYLHAAEEADKAL